MTSEQQPDPFSECQHLVVERNDSVALLTMNRPEAMNATNAPGIHVVQTLLRRPARLGRQRPRRSPATRISRPRASCSRLMVCQSPAPQWPARNIAASGERECRYYAN